MKAILTIGYNKYLVQGDASSLMTTIDGLVPVKEKGEYGKEIFIPDGTIEKFEIVFVSNDRIALNVMEAEMKPGLLKALEDAEKTSSEERSKRWVAEQKVKELEKKLSGVGQIVPVDKIPI